MLRLHRPRIVAACVVCICASLSFSNAKASTLDDAIVSMASNISDYLTEKGQNQIMLGDFDGPGAATAGRAIRAKLKEELANKNTVVVPLGANWTVRGAFSFEPSGSSAIVLIKADLFDKAGKEISGFREKVKVESVSSIEDISRLLGVTVDLKTEQENVAGVDDSSAKSGDAKSKSEVATKLISKQADVTEKLVSSVTEPVFAFRNDTKSQLSPDSDSLFKVEVLVKRAGASSYAPEVIDNAGGFPFANLKANDVYRIRVYNDASHAVGVKLSVDGINSFALSEEPSYRESGTWFIPARSQGTISGWYINGALLKEFLVTAKGDSLGLPDASDIGTVTVQFFHAWKDGEVPPAVERLASSRGQLRTGVGRGLSRNIKFTRSFFGKTLLSSISIRYSNPDDLPPPN